MLTLAAGLLAACGAPEPDALDLRQALRLRLIDEALGVTNPSKRPKSIDEIQIQDVVIDRTQGLPSGDYDLWSVYGITYRSQQSRQTAIVTLTPDNGAWRVLSIRPTTP